MMEAKDWYKARNDRTGRMEDVSVETIEQSSVDVIIGELEINQYSNQIMVLVGLNILSRWCSNVNITIPDGVQSCLPGLKGDFATILQELMYKADPFGKFSFQKEFVQRDSDATLIIGKTEIENPASFIWIDSDGWICGYGSNNKSHLKKTKADKNPIGASFAACLGVAELFKWSHFQKQYDGPGQWYSLYDHKGSTEIAELSNPNFPDNLDLGNIYQIGCGAVGSSLDYLLPFTNWEFNLLLIDYDKVDISNCSSSLCFTANDAFTDRPKTAVCKDWLNTSKIVASDFEGNYSQLIASGEYRKNPPDIILCLANEQQVWPTIQYNYPPLVYHATTSSSWGLNIGRHIPIKEWCIVCRFGIRNHQFIPRCATGIIDEVKKNQKEKLGNLPFLSVASAVLLLSEMAKISVPSYEKQPNFIQFSMRIAGATFLNQLRGKRNNCPICTNQNWLLSPETIRNSKHWQFSGT